MTAGGLGNLFAAHSDSRFKSHSRTQTSRRKLIDKGSSNPYAILRFGSQSQRTSVVAETTDPIWPREEQFYLDLSLPVMKLTHPNEEKDRKMKAIISHHHPPKLHISLHHADNYKVEYSEKIKKEPPSKPSNDPLLGCASMDVSSILHGKKACLDEWLTLVGDTDSEAGQVRLICEYEPTDAPPRPGDLCRFTSLVNPRDVYPLSVSNTFRVDDVIEDYVYISSRTRPENWLSTCRVHRFMILCEHRHQTAVERYQDEILQVAEKLVYSPMVSVLNEKIERLPEEGVLSLGIETVTKGIGLLGRWYHNGLCTAVEDVIHVTNWDGRFNPRVDRQGESVIDIEGFSLEDESNLSYDEDDGGMEDGGVKLPNCPITGLPMKNPVVAADGVRLSCNKMLYDCQYRLTVAHFCFSILMKSLQSLDG